VGKYGELGYEGKRVTVRGRSYTHALSAHPPSHLCFALEGRFETFRCEVALNDDVTLSASHADFQVSVDGRQVAPMPFVVAGEPPREIVVNCAGAQRLELSVRTSRWDFCHAVWLDPELLTTDTRRERRCVDCLERVEIALPTETPRADLCIATIVSPGYEPLLTSLLRSLTANGGCPGARVVALMVDPDERCVQAVEQSGALPVHCHALARVNATVKSALYSVARIVNAERYLCLDADILVLGDLKPLFAALDAVREGSILVARDAQLGYDPLLQQLCRRYAGRPSDMEALLGQVFDEGNYDLIVNDGVFAGSRGALLALDGIIRGMRGAPAWVDARPDHGWRNQFIFNLALARLHCGVEIAPVYNWQTHECDVDLEAESGQVLTRGGGRAVRLLHFCGPGRDRYPEIRARFA